MDENQIQEETKISESENIVPADADNTNSETENKETVKQNEGQSEKKDPSNELILGKFKSIDDLTKAYEELQKHQGKSSEELGSLRKDLAKFNEYKGLVENLNNYQASIIPVIERDKQLYNTPEYFQNPVFKEIYSEALMTFGDNLDTDRMINLLEKYVDTRIASYDKEKSAKNETQNVLDSMTYSNNPKNTMSPPKKTLDEMSDDEFKASLRKLI